MNIVRKTGLIGKLLKRRSRRQEKAEAQAWLNRFNQVLASRTSTDFFDTLHYYKSVMDYTLTMPAYFRGTPTDVWVTGVCMIASRAYAWRRANAWREMRARERAREQGLEYPSLTPTAS